MDLGNRIRHRAMNEFIQKYLRQEIHVGLTTKVNSVCMLEARFGTIYAVNNIIIRIDTWTLGII
jgi:hypothetical protein